MARNECLLCLAGTTPDEVGLVLARKVFERPALGLGNEEGGQKAGEHEEGEELQKMVDPGVGTTDILEETEANLSKDGPELAGGGGDAVTGRAIASGEDLAGDDEGVEEQLSEGEEDDEENTRVVRDGGVAEAKDDEEDPRNGAEQIDDDVADNCLEEGGVRVGVRGEADGSQDEGVVQAKTVPRNIESEPGVSGAEQDLAVFPLAKVSFEVAPRSLGNIRLFKSLGLGVVARGGATLDEGGGVLDTLVDFAFNIHGEAGSLGDGKAESGNGRDTAKTDDDTPDLVERVDVGLDGALIGDENDEGDDSGSKDTETLHGKDGGHHGTAAVGGGELGVTTDTKAEEDAPEDDASPDGHGRAVGGKGLPDGGDNDNYQLDTVHLLAAVTIGEIAKEELANHGANRGGDLDGGVDVRGELALVALAVVDIAEHDRDQVDGEEIV
ncbi:LOW QUALITY PROTEIN: hypothetical protein BC936DRAFT_141818 [Jimgerdemannia flammicorona]|uniref:Uncharacterized protein n=1 Tax=Jimgerdemannia flammicorona TaxID=994334 RepID=A0A433DFQ9_9FUNG|nr:LOW QUALITY PROTEIN: hypothetical protein BC936DRAFT_141818 [Jimgerdemannia flammicorona]